MSIEISKTEALLQGHRILIPHHVQAMDRSERKIWMAERKILPAPVEHWNGPGTSFSGFETLASMQTVPGEIGPTAALLSILSRECVEPIAPVYMSQIGKRFWIRAYGNIDTTAVVPTFQFQLVAGPTIANPLTTGQMLAQNVAITPAAAVTGTLEWFLELFVVVRATGSSGSLFATGTLFNDWVTALTFVQTTMKNAVEASAVVMTGAGGLLVPIYLDLEVIMGAATAGNTVACLDYQLVSTN
jgi:hypothetical protein